MVIGAVLLSALIMFLSRTAALFPFYMTIVTETYNLANIASADNYIKEQYYEDALEDLRDRPLFNNAYTQDAEIYVLNEEGIELLEMAGSSGTIKERLDSINFGDGWAVGSNDEYDYAVTDGPDGKPYRQQGRPVQIVVTAEYPFQFTMWGRDAGFNVPVSFSITTNGLKYYKDLPMDNPYDTSDVLDEIDYYDTSE